MKSLFIFSLVTIQAYLLMNKYLGMTNEECGNTFDEWNKGDLDSYLIEVSFCLPFGRVYCD